MFGRGSGCRGRFTGLSFWGGDRVPVTIGGRSRELAGRVAAEGVIGSVAAISGSIGDGRPDGLACKIAPLEQVQPQGFKSVPLEYDRMMALYAPARTPQAPCMHFSTLVSVSGYHYCTVPYIYTWTGHHDYASSAGPSVAEAEKRRNSV